MSTAIRVAKNSGYLYAKMGITMFISLYTTRLVLGALGEEDYGIFNIVGGAIAMLGFFNAAMSGATQRFISYAEGAGNKDQLRYIFNISVLLHGILALFLVVLLMVSGVILFDKVLNIPPARISAAKAVYGALIVSTAFTVMTVPYDAVLNAHENMRFYAIVGLCESLLKLVVAFIVAHILLDKLLIYGVLMAVVSVIPLVIIRLYCRNRYAECRMSLQHCKDRKLVREMSTFAVWNFFQTAAAMLTNYGLGIILNSFFGAKINAAQGVASQLNGQLSAVDNVLMKAVRPVIMKAEGGGDVHYSLSMAKSVSKISFLSTVVFVIPAIITMPRLLYWWLDEVPQYTVIFTTSMLIITMLEQSVAGFITLIMARGDIRGISIVKSCFKIACLPLCYLFYKWGMSPVAGYILLVVIQGVINGVVVTMAYMHCRVGYSFIQAIKELFIPILYVLFPIVIVSKTLACIDGLWGMCVVWIVSVPLIVILTYYLLFDKRERAMFIRILKSIKPLLQQLFKSKQNYKLL